MIDPVSAGATGRRQGQVNPFLAGCDRRRSSILSPRALGFSRSLELQALKLLLSALLYARSGAHALDAEPLIGRQPLGQAGYPEVPRFWRDGQPRAQPKAGTATGGRCALLPCMLTLLHAGRRVVLCVYQYILLSLVPCMPLSHAGTKWFWPVQLGLNKGTLSLCPRRAQLERVRAPQPALPLRALLTAHPSGRSTEKPDISMFLFLVRFRGLPLVRAARRPCLAPGPPSACASRRPCHFSC